MCPPTTSTNQIWDRQLGTRETRAKGFTQEIRDFFENFQELLPTVQMVSVHLKHEACFEVWPHRVLWLVSPRGLGFRVAWQGTQSGKRKTSNDDITLAPSPQHFVVVSLKCLATCCTGQGCTYGCRGMRYMGTRVTCTSHVPATPGVTWQQA